MHKRLKADASVAWPLAIYRRNDDAKLLPIFTGTERRGSCFDRYTFPPDPRRIPRLFKPVACSFPGIYKAYQLGKYPNITIVLHGDQSIQGTGHETEFLKELDDKTTSYAILSHRWGNEVSYKEIIGLTRTRKKQEGNN